MCIIQTSYKIWTNRAGISKISHWTTFSTSGRFGALCSDLRGRVNARFPLHVAFLILQSPSTRLFIYQLILLHFAIFYGPLYYMFSKQYVFVSEFIDKLVSVMQCKCLNEVLIYSDVRVRTGSTLAQWYL